MTRPKSVEFAYSRHRNRSLASADRIEMISGGMNAIEPDDAVISKAKVANGGLPKFNTARLQAPKLRIKKLGERRRLNIIPSSRDGGDRNGRAQHGLLSIDPSPMTAINRMSHNRNAVGGEGRGWSSRLSCEARGRGHRE